jgi:hypothetical protein
MTARLIEEIILSGSCQLTPLEQSSKMHKLFLESMLNHWNIVQGRNDEIIPIT